MVGMVPDTRASSPSFRPMTFQAQIVTRATPSASYSTALMNETLIFIPAWNEEDSVADVVREIRREMPDVDILVVDDGSRDATAAQARQAGALVTSLPFNQGLGAALQTGYRFARRHGYRYAAHCDADGQHPAREIARLLAPVRAGSCDLALGSRWLNPEETEAPEDEQRYRPSLMRRLGIGFFRRLLTRATGQTFTDATSGFRAANARVIEVFADRYGHDYPELESLTRCVRAGLRVQEVPVMMRPRAAGESKITTWKSAYWVFNGVVSLTVACLRPRHATTDGEARP